VRYWPLIYQFESENKVNPLNETDMYCLHYVFLPRINAALTAFVDTWNNHPISTEHNLTPNQLFIRGALEQNLIPEMPQLQSQQQLNQQLPAVSSHIEVPRNVFAPCISLRHELVSNVNPLQSSHNFGRDIYHHAINIVGLHLHQGCSDCTTE